MFFFHIWGLKYGRNHNNVERIYTIVQFLEAIVFRSSNMYIISILLCTSMEMKAFWQAAAIPSHYSITLYEWIHKLYRNNSWTLKINLEPYTIVHLEIYPHRMIKVYVQCSVENLWPARSKLHVSKIIIKVHNFFFVV